MRRIGVVGGALVVLAAAWGLLGLLDHAGPIRSAGPRALEPGAALPVVGGPSESSVAKAALSPRALAPPRRVVNARDEARRIVGRVVAVDTDGVRHERLDGRLVLGEWSPPRGDGSPLGVHRPRRVAVRGGRFELVPGPEKIGR
ncbi:MAG: hypothetical protein ACF8XB_13665, partial [Planctomycetota bacterium JB042]